LGFAYFFVAVLWVDGLGMVFPGKSPQWAIASLSSLMEVLATVMKQRKKFFKGVGITN
jgi:hypothetical protein